MSAALSVRQWVKARKHPCARFAYTLATAARHASMPVVPGLHAALYQARSLGLAGWRNLKRVVWDTPLFLSQMRSRPRRVMLYGGIPMLIGPLDITLGEGCRISGQTTFTGRAGRRVPNLQIGRNCDIGWQTTIAVGTQVRLGDNVRIAGRAFLAGYPGHPLDAAERAAGLPDHEAQCGAIILDDDVWLATGVTISAGVRIGRGTIVAAGSVVTHDLPDYVLAGGVPARVLRPLNPEDVNHVA